MSERQRLQSMYGSGYDQLRRRRRAACGRGGEWKLAGVRMAAHGQPVDVTVTFHMLETSDDDMAKSRRYARLMELVVVILCMMMRQQRVEELFRSHILVASGRLDSLYIFILDLSSSFSFIATSTLKLLLV